MPTSTVSFPASLWEARSFTTSEATDTERATSSSLASEPESLAGRESATTGLVFRARALTPVPWIDPTVRVACLATLVIVTLCAIAESDSGRIGSPSRVRTDPNTCVTWPRSRPVASTVPTVPFTAPSASLIATLPVLKLPAATLPAATPARSTCARLA